MEDDVDHDDSLQSSQEPNAESCLHSKCQGGGIVVKLNLMLPVSFYRFVIS